MESSLKHWKVVDAKSVFFPYLALVPMEWFTLSVASSSGVPFPVSTWPLLLLQVDCRLSHGRRDGRRLWILCQYLRRSPAGGGGAVDHN